MATTLQTRKPSWFLLFPWSLLSIVLILVFDIAFADFFGKNWNWIILVLIIPAAIIENLKVGYSTLRIMFLKIVYSLLSFLVVGLTFGISAAGWYYERFQQVQIPRVNIPWYVLLGLGVILLIELAQIFSMLKAVKREFMQFDPDN
jgi:hypothetical protein